MRLGMTEILIILAVAVVLFGSGKLAGVGKSLGTSIREFKEEVKKDTPDTKGEGEDGARGSDVK